MRSILEQALVALVDNDEERAAQLIHKFIVGRARQIHETFRNGDDMSLVESDMNHDDMYSEIDLASLAEDDEDDAGDVVDADLGGDDAAGSDDMDGDMDASAVDGDVDGDEDGEGEGDEGSAEDRIADLEDRLADLEDHDDDIDAEIAKLLASLGDDEDGDFDADADADADGDLDAGVEDDADMEVKDDMGEEEPKMEGFVDEDDQDENFDDIAESITSELKKIATGNTDGMGTDGKKVFQNQSSALPQKSFATRAYGEKMKSEGEEVGNGGKTSTNTKSALPQKSKEARVNGAAPTVIKAKQHKGFAKETAPSTETVKVKNPAKTK